MKIVLDEGAYVPTRAHETDAGLDLYAMYGGILYPTKDAAKSNGRVFDTGVHVELPPGYYGKIESKSGLNVKHGVVSCGGVIDEGYTGPIMVKLYNLGGRPYEISPGDKIAQLVIMPYATPTLEIVDTLNPTERGDNGFGSTGR